MATFTLYFCGTDCWHDEGIENRKNIGGSDPKIYGPQAGYIPVKLYGAQKQTRDQLKAIMPGPGAPWYAERSKLWVPCTIETKGGATRDRLTGESMWDIAGHAAAKVVGIRSTGRAKPEMSSLREFQLRAALRSKTGAVVNEPNSKPPSHDPYLFSVDELEKLKKQEFFGLRKVTTINAIGHSRGGVAAIMVAHELKYLFPDVDVNIFAIDPVPGTGDLSKEMVTLAGNVKNYVGVYAIDEISGGFNGVVPWPIHKGSAIDPLERTTPSTRITVPNYHLIFAPGRHATVAGNQTPDGKAEPGMDDDDIAAVGTLVSRLASACLRAWSTDVPLTQFGRHDLDWHKQKMTDAAAKYRKMRDYSYILDTHTHQHWRERGITSSEGISGGSWEYLEDSIGNEPLETRSTLSPSYTRPNPGTVLWEAIQDIDNSVFNSGRWSLL